MNDERIITLPWPARLWKPQMGALEKSLSRSLWWRIGLSLVITCGFWLVGLLRLSGGAAARECAASVLVVSVFAPLCLLVIYPRQRRREVKLPVSVELGERGISFKFTEPVWVRWSEVKSYSLGYSNDSGIKHLELLIANNGEDRTLAFPYDPDEIDEVSLGNLLAARLPGREKKALYVFDYSCEKYFQKN